jgi:hypothetical protein
MEASKELSGPIQVLPSGLLGFFGIKSPAGRNPTVMPDVLQPVIDLIPWYFNTQSQGDNVVHLIDLNTTFSGFSGFVNGIVVPQNEYWFVEYYSVFSALLVAGDAIAFSPAFQNPTAGTTQDFLLTDLPESQFFSGPNNRAAKTARDFWLPPGSSLGAYYRAVTTSTSIRMTGNLRYTAMRV